MSTRIQFDFLIDFGLVGRVGGVGRRDILQSSFMDSIVIHLLNMH